MPDDKYAKCAKCGHIKDLHQRYVRNLSCCYDCHCKGYEKKETSV